MENYSSLQDFEWERFESDSENDDDQAHERNEIEDVGEDRSGNPVPALGDSRERLDAKLSNSEVPPEETGNVNEEGEQPTNCDRRPMEISSDQENENNQGEQNRNAEYTREALFRHRQWIEAEVAEMRNSPFWRSILSTAVWGYLWNHSLEITLTREFVSHSLSYAKRRIRAIQLTDVLTTIGRYTLIAFICLEVIYVLLVFLVMYLQHLDNHGR